MVTTLNEQTLPVRLCTVVTRGGETVTPFVPCSRKPAPADARDCASCMRMRSLEWKPGRGGTVRCLANTADIDPRADFGELAARTLVREIARRTFTCVTPDVPLARVRAALKTERALVVVDDENKLVGLISRTDLADAPAEGTAGDIMKSPVHALEDDAPISYVVPLLSMDDISEVPLVTADGEVTALCHSLDVVRWLSSHLGFEAR